MIGQGRDLYILADGASTRPAPVSGAFRREARYHQLQADENALRRERLRWKRLSRLAKDLYRERDRS